MTRVTRTFDVRPAPSVVIDYLKDLEHAVEWDPATSACQRHDLGDIAVGACWQITASIAGLHFELTYILAKLADDGVVFVGRNEGATAIDTIDVTPLDGGSRVVYNFELKVRGRARRMAVPAAKLFLEAHGNAGAQQMADALNRLG